MLHIDPVSTLCLTRGDARTLLWSGASALALLVAMAATPVAAQTCAFSSNQDAGANTLRACVEQANAGAADTVASGLAPNSTVLLQTPIEITRDMAIGAGGSPVTLSGGSLRLVDDNILTVTGEVTVKDGAAGLPAISMTGMGGILDFSGKIVTAQDDAVGIIYGNTVGDGATTVHMRGIITTSGQSASGAVADTDDSRFFLYGTIETSGRYASGINAEGLRKEFHLLEGSAITVSGLGSDGIGAYVDQSKILVDGTITTRGEAEGTSAGMGANGITVVNIGDVGNEVRLQGHGAIVTEADYANGIYAEGGGNRIYLENGSRIETKGALAAAAISFTGTGNRVEMTGATITTHGVNSGGIVTGSGNQVLVGQDSEIITHGQSSAGIRSGGSGGTITLDAGSQIKTGGNFAYGIDANLNAVVLEAGSRIETAGQRAYGINFATTQTSPRGNAVIAGAIATSGEFAAGIQASAGRSDITIKSGGSVVTTGGSAPGQIIPHAMSLNGGGNRVTVEAGALVSSVADNAHGIWMSPSTGLGNNWVYVGGTVSATGAGANAIRFTTGNNRLELQPGYDIVGDVVGVGNDVLAFGGEGSASFDLARLGGQYTGFGSMQKVGGSTWTLTDNGAGFTGPINITGGTLDVAGTLGGTLSVQSGGTLGGSGTLGAVTVGNGGILSPGNSPGTLSMASLMLNSASVLDFELGTPGLATASDRIDVSGSLTLDGVLNVTDAGGFGNGVYTLINYGTLAADNGLTLGATPHGYSYAIDAGTGTASAVTLAVSGGAGGNSQYWDGANATPGGTLYGRGGAGVWNDANTNWTDMAGAVNGVWGDQFGIFYNDTGNVTVEGVQSATGLQFASDGYRLVPGAGGALQLTGATSVLRVDAAATATLALPLTVAGDLTKQGAGTLELAADATIGSEMQVMDGVLRVTDNADVQVNGNMAVGSNAGSVGRVEIANATLRVGGPSLVVRKTGTLSMENSARLDVGDRFVGIYGGAIEAESASTFELGWIHIRDGGSLHVSGPGTEVAVSNTAGATAPNVIGLSSDGTLVLDDQARMTTANVDIGRGSVGAGIGQSAIATVKNSAHWESGELSVGVEGGHGELHIVDAGTVVSTAGQIADGAGGNPARSSTGLVTVSGHGSTWTIIGDLTIGTASGNGTLEVVDQATVTAGSLAGNGNVSINTGAALTVGGNDASTTFAGVIGGDSDFTKTGSGVLTLTGANTFSGITTINQGTLILGNGGTTGSVAGNIVNNNAFLAFNRSNDVTYDGVLSGSGVTSFIGTGMTTLTGDSSGLGGPAFVTAGNLRIASGGSLGTSLLTVDTDGTLSGLGRIVGNVNVGGRLAPGADTLGALSVAGNVDFEAGSTYAIRIAGTNPDPWPAARADTLSIGGAADLAGGTVEITAIDPRTSYVDGYTYATPILSAGGGLGGTEFAGVGMASGSAFITPTLQHLTGTVFLTIAVTQDFTTATQTFNQRQAAGALNDLEQTGDALAVFNTIANMNADDARRAFDHVSGEVHASGQHVIDQTFALFNRTLRYQGVAGVGTGNVGAQVFTAPLGYGPAAGAGNEGVVAIDDATDYADARVRGAWAAPLGGFGHVDGDGNAGKLDWWNAGLAGGYEGVIDVASGKAVGGFGFGYIHSRGTIDDRLSTFDADGFYLGAYGAWADGPWNVAGSLSYGANRVSTERNIAFMGTTAEASYWTHTIGASGEASYAFDLAGTTKIAPLFTLDTGWSGHGGFTETGAGALNLTSGSQSWTRLDAGLGIALTHTILTESGTVTLEGRAVWEHAFADTVPSQSLALAGSPTSFTILGPDAGRDRLRIGAGLSWDVSDDMTVRARYDGLFSGNQANHSATLGLNIRF